MREDEQEGTSPEWRFVGFLRGLERSEDRGALAKLRRSVGKDYPSAEALRLIAPFLPQDQTRSWKTRCYELVAGLFAAHPAAGGGGNMGDAFLRLGSHESAQKRFVALLDSDPDDLPHRLRQAVSLARSKDVPIDWARLLTDLLHWDDESRWVQYKWARAYWANANVVGDQKSAADVAAAVEGA